MNNLQEINVLINAKGKIIVIDNNCDWELGEYYDWYDFIADTKKLDKCWYYLFDEYVRSIDEDKLSNEKSTIFTFKLWEERIPDIECGGYDYNYNIVNIKKVKIDY